VRSQATAKLGRFDQSFVIRMIRDFLLALTIIVVFELGGRLLLAMNHFEREDREATEVAAERLAQDVKDIMLNSGGPVAARTVYPIIRRNHSELGLEIAIVPSEIAVQSIQKTFSCDCAWSPSFGCVRPWLGSPRADWIYHSGPLRSRATSSVSWPPTSITFSIGSATSSRTSTAY
jgi:hypothetical protein